MKKRHKYDKELIEELCKKQPVDAFNLTDVAKKYCKKKGIDFSVYIARVIQQIVANSNLSISNVKPVKSVAYTAAVKRKFQSNKSNFIVTWAQAHTPIDENLWENIQQYAAFTNAEIIVMPGTYLNNNSVFTKRIEVWDSKLVDYLYATEANIHNHLIMIPDADIISEISTFIESRGSYSADEGYHDDLVMPLVLFAWLSRQPYFKELTNLDTRLALFKNEIKQLEEDLAPFGFISTYDEDDMKTFTDGNDVWTSERLK
jgi:hypothetical protein